MSETVKTNREAAVLITSVLLISSCAIFYELLISTVSSYFLGSSVLHFSLTIGLFMFFMGVGSFLSKYIEEELLSRFIIIEIVLGALGGASVLLLYAAFGLTEWYHLTAFVLTAAISTLVGVEIPLVTRLLRAYQPLKDLVANVLAFDYIGALIASVLFPLVMLPYLGVMRTAFVVGVLNIAVALVNTYEFRGSLPKPFRFSLFCSIGMLVLGTAFFSSTSLSNIFESTFYNDEIVLSQQSPYQKIVLTKDLNDFRLYLNGELQFSSIDEHRYHESLAHVPLAVTYNRERILVLGGGDGLAVRELQKYPDIREIVLVDLDKAVTDLGRTHALFTALNRNSLQDSRVRIVNDDAWRYLKDTPGLFNVIIIDLPDPNEPVLGKLYSKEFYQLVQKRLTPDGIMVTQATSPYFSKEAYWSIHATLAAVFPAVLPYTTYVPSFGQWGFVLASKSSPLLPPQKLLVSETKYLSASTLPTLFHFDADLAAVPSPINTIDGQELFTLYTESANRWD